MGPDDVEVTDTQLFHANAADVDALEKQLGIAFPPGYREFIGRFGEGELAGHIRVYPPYQILDGDNCLSEWRKRIDEYWLWDEGREVLPKAKALECVIVADTLEGDEVIFHPSDPDKLYVLPRDEEQVYVADGGMWGALEWLLGAGVLGEAIDERSFEPFDGMAARSEDDDEAMPEVTDLVATESMHYPDGRVVCRVYRMGAEHFNEAWEEGDPLPVDESVIKQRALEAAVAEFGEPARLEDLELECWGTPPHYEAMCAPVADKGFGFHNRTIYLDLRGTPIAATEHVFQNEAEYEEFQRGMAEE